MDDTLDEKNTRTYAKESEAIHKALTRQLDHVQDQMNVKVEQITQEGKPSRTASFRVDYRHTLGGVLHFVYVNASASMDNIPKPVSVSSQGRLKYLLNYSIQAEYFVDVE